MQNALYHSFKINGLVTIEKPNLYKLGFSIEFSFCSVLNSKTTQKPLSSQDHFQDKLRTNKTNC